MYPFCLVITLLQSPWPVVGKKKGKKRLLGGLNGEVFLQRNHFFAAAFLFRFCFVMNKLNGFLPWALEYLQSCCWGKKAKMS